MFVSPTLLLLAACGPGSDVYVTSPGAPTDTGPTTTVPAEPDLAGGIAVRKISIYQGVESVLWQDGAPPSTAQVPIITNRAALLRIFVEPEDGWETRRVVAHLTLRQAGGEEEVLTARRRIEGRSTNADLQSTLNFDLTADQVRKPTEFYLELREDSVEAPGGGRPTDATFDSEKDLPGGLATEASDELTIAIIPIRYNWDGSGRVPDTSPSHIERIRQLAQAMYPASTVHIRVDPTQNWNSQISPFNSNQWSSILDGIATLRDAANEPPNTYYYGMFDPEPTLQDFCRSGCILGLSNLGFSTTQEWLRSSVGVGYTTQNTAAETLVHEVGHAHGRYHSPCGGAAGPDPGYPYPNAAIGSWGYSTETGELFDPNEHADVMGYCYPLWISDYTYYELWRRIATLSGQARSAPQRVTRLRVDDAGHTRVVGTVRSRGPAGGIEVDVALFDEQGEPAGLVDGWMFPNSHFDGGVVTLDFELKQGWTAEVL